jgi:hypothetical protein
MAIDRIPGVGPQNTDIATAVAAAVPNSAAITAAVPTAAQIATAVAAPSAATIAATVAAPSIATITSAITTNAASAGVTMAAITSTVQANAGSPFGGTWTFLSSQNPAASSISFTGLSGYKKYRLYIITYKSGTSYSLNCTINGLSGYGYSTSALRSSNTSPLISQEATGSNFQLTPTSITDGFTCHGYLDFDQASSGQYKTIDWIGGHLSAGTNQATYVVGHAWVKETAAINRIDLNANTALGPLGSTGFWLFGGN